MRRILPFFLAIFGLSTSLQAQQLPVFSEYMHNAFTMNPAMLGWESITAATLAYRHQWTGMPNAPRTPFMSYQQWEQDKNMGLGGYFMYDRTGPTSFATLTLNYAYHIRLKSEQKGEWERSRLALGLSLGGTVYSLRGRDLRYNDADDELIINANQSRFLPDVGFGMMYYNDLYYVGLSMPQLISMRVRFTDDLAISNLRRITHFYLNAGAKFELKSKKKGEKQFLMPALVFKYAPSSPLNLYLSMRYMWNYRFSAALGASTDGSLIADANVNISQKFRIGYAFSLPVTGILPHVGTTHEIMLTYVFGSTGKGWMFEPIERTWLRAPAPDCLQF